MSRKKTVVEPVDEPELEEVKETVESEPVEPVAVEPVADPAVETTEQDSAEKETLVTKVVGFLKGLTKKEEKKPAQNNMFFLTKDVNGKYHALGIVTNKWRDRDYLACPEKGGEIITEQAHMKFMGYLDAHPENAPLLECWHTTGSHCKARAEWWAYQDGFVFMSWPLEDKEAEIIQKAAKDHTLGMSHGFVGLSRDKKNGLIHSYISHEASYLPLDAAANIYTDFTVTEVNMFAPEKRKFLADVFGEGKVVELETLAEETGKALAESGVESKDYNAEDTTIKTVEIIAKSFSEQVAILKDIQATVTQHSALIANLQKSEDEKIAEQITPKARPVEITPASQSHETIITDERAKELAPKPESWILKAHGG